MMLMLITTGSGCDGPHTITIITFISVITIITVITTGSGCDRPPTSSLQVCGLGPWTVDYCSNLITQ